MQASAIPNANDKKFLKHGQCVVIPDWYFHLSSFKVVASKYTLREAADRLQMRYVSHLDDKAIFFPQVINLSKKMKLLPRLYDAHC